MRTKRRSGPAIITSSQEQVALPCPKVKGHLVPDVSWHELRLASRCKPRESAQKGSIYGPVIEV